MKSAAELFYKHHALSWNVDLHTHCLAATVANQGSGGYERVENTRPLPSALVRAVWCGAECKLTRGGREVSDADLNETCRVFLGPQKKILEPCFSCGHCVLLWVIGPYFFQWVVYGKFEKSLENCENNIYRLLFDVHSKKILKKIFEHF